MLIVAVCEKMGWDYFTYQKQPSWFVDLIIEQMIIDGKKAKEKEQQARATRPVGRGGKSRR